MPAEPIEFIAFDCAFVLVMVGLSFWLATEPENADQRGALLFAAATAAVPAPPVQQMTAAAPAVRLRYFPYSTVGRRASEKLVCGICLEAFQDGETCGEVPACRHFFHRACVDVWRKSSVTCPLCRGYMAMGSTLGRVSAADDMV